MLFNTAATILGILSWVRGADNVGGELDRDDVEELQTGAVLYSGIGAEGAVDL